MVDYTHFMIRDQLMLTLSKTETASIILQEDNLKIYQVQGGGVELAQQALNLIQTTSQFEAEKK